MSSMSSVSPVSAYLDPKPGDGTHTFFDASIQERVGAGESGKRVRHERDVPEDSNPLALKFLLRDLPPEILRYVLAAMKNNNCAALQNACRINRAFADICSDKDEVFWRELLRVNRWMIDWDTGLGMKALYAILCKMGEEGCRSKLLSLKKDTTSIQSEWFNRCKSLVLKALPPNVKHIMRYAFSYCSSLALTALPSNLESIGDMAFVKCKSLALTAMPPNLRRIANGTFSCCNSCARTARTSHTDKSEGDGG